MKNAIFMALFLVGMTPQMTSAKDRSPASHKTQEVNFDEASIDGEARTPDGAYLHQKRGMKFVPLYKVKARFDTQIKESVDYLR